MEKRETYKTVLFLIFISIADVLLWRWDGRDITAVMCPAVAIRAAFISFLFLCVLRNDLNTPGHREVDERYGKKYMILFSNENERNKLISEEKQDYHVNPH